MKYDGVFFSGVGSYYPEPYPVARAIETGDYDQASQEKTDQVSVTIATDSESQPEMAVAAGRLALKHSGYRTRDVSLLLHAVAVYSGLDGWNSASYLQNEVLDGNGISFEIRQVSNGALGGLELAIPYIQSGRHGPAAIITSSERFAPPAWNRWRADSGLIFADGASALVVSTEGGFGRLVSLVTETASELEGLHRGLAPFQTAPDPAQYPLDLHSRAVEFSDEMDIATIHAISERGLKAAATRASHEAGLNLDEIEIFVVPNFGRSLLQRQVLDPIGISIERSTHHWGKNVGHAGAADQFGALHNLVESGGVASGDHVMLVGVGGGFNWTCAVIQLTGAACP